MSFLLLAAETLPSLDTASLIQLVAGGVFSFFMWTTKRTVGETDRKVDILMGHRDESRVELAELRLVTRQQARDIAELKALFRHKTGEHEAIR